MKRYREIYRAEQLPIFQNRMFHSEEEAKNCAKADVVLAQDLDTGLISNRAFNPKLMHYDADYQNEQAVSGVFQRHLQNVSAVISQHFQGSSLIEVGCGKGYFLEQLQTMGFEITGLDPTYEGANPSVIREYFGPEIGLRAEGIILRHVLEHVQDPVAFLSNIRAANGGGGKIYIEVPCFDWICDHHAWFDIFYEHVNYFRLSDLCRMFGVVHEAGHLFNGQYLYAVADLSTIRVPVCEGVPEFKFPATFLDSINRFAAKLKQGNAGNGTVAALWGGASKGVIFALLMGRAGATVNMVIDINPAKQGKFLAATGLQVQSPEAALEALPPDAEILVMNRNYLQEIKAYIRGRFNCIPVDYENI